MVLGRVTLAWYTAQVLPPRNNPLLAHRPPLTASIVRCWDDRYGVEWLLLATWPVNSADDAAQYVQWYEQRWSIEEFHKCLKSGCQIERSQLKQAQAVDVLLGFVVWSPSACWRWPVWRACGQTPSPRTISTRPFSPFYALCAGWSRRP
ncbi:MAG: transposase [Acidiferrobacter sp.]